MDRIRQVLIKKSNTRSSLFGLDRTRTIPYYNYNRALLPLLAVLFGFNGGFFFTMFGSKRKKGFQASTFCLFLYISMYPVQFKYFFILYILQQYIEDMSLGVKTLVFVQTILGIILRATKIKEHFQIYFFKGSHYSPLYLILNILIMLC